MKKIAIIGAGISGLYFANLLERNKTFEYQIFEKKNSIDLTDGYGIQLSVNSIKLLHKVGLRSKFATYAAALFLLKEDRNSIMPTDKEMLRGILEEELYLRQNYAKNFSMLREDAPANATGAAVAGTGDDKVHWRHRGVKSGMRGRKQKVGRSISALNFIKQRNKLMANTNVKSSYPAGAFKLESANPRIARKSGQPAKSDKHSDLYTDENPKGTIHGLKFATVKDARASVSKISGSGKSHAHKIQAAVAMEQRAREMGKSSQAAVYRAYINKMKKKTKAKNEITEQKEIKKTIGIYGGRFQPFHSGHMATYKWLKSKVDDVYITTSNIKKPPRHPMNFKEKVEHMVKMGVPKNRIVEEASPYVAKNTLKKFCLFAI